MRAPQRARSTAIGINRTPMIDVVFQLIIFFMTVSQMSQANQEPLQLPKQQGLEDHQPKTVVINVTATGDLRVGGEDIDMPRLIARINQEMVGVGADPSKLRIVVRGDERGPSRGVNEVVRALAKLRVTHVRIAVQSGG